MTNIDRRSAIIMGTAGAALLASSATTSAQGGGEAARNKEILTRAYKLWHETKGGSVNDWMEIVDDAGVRFSRAREPGVGTRGQSNFLD